MVCDRPEVIVLGYWNEDGVLGLIRSFLRSPPTQVGLTPVEIDRTMLEELLRSSCLAAIKTSLRSYNRFLAASENTQVLSEMKVRKVRLTFVMAFVTWMIPIANYHLPSWLLISLPECSS